MQLKLFLTYLLVSLLGLFLAGVLILTSERKRSLTQLEQSMFSQTHLLSIIFSTSLCDSLSLAKIDSLTDELSRDIQGRITIIDKQGKVLGDSYESGEKLSNMENHRNRPEVASALQDKHGKSIRYSYTVKEEMLYVASPIKFQGEIIGVARLALPLTELRHQQNRILNIVLLGLVLAFIFSLVLSLGFADRVSKPLRQMIQIGKSMSKGDFTQRTKTKTRDEIGELGEILNQMSDELSQKIAQISEEKSQLDSVLSSMVEGVLAVDSSGKVLLVNKTLSQVFNLGSANYGKPYYEVIRNPELDQFIQEVLTNPKEKRKEVSFFHPEEKDFMVQSALVEQKRKGSISLLFVFHDITELKKTERVRKDFVANVSHELRTPLTSIKGFVEALRDGAINDPEKSLQFLSIISQHADRMNKIVTDLLQLSRIESKDFTLKIEPFFLKELLDEVSSTLKNSAQDKSQILEISLPSPDLQISADRHWIIQALTNLVDNAIKYTPEKGKIRIEVKDKGESVEIAVIDNGIGIPQKDLPRIFERFYRVDKGRSRESGGTGLGLSIVKHIIEAHAGKVEVKSQEGKGSEFSFTLRKV
ncbi:MAG: phosphate regulon sensor histidine kinase PhoR [candidate division Zixibacteria bacterium]|nr:phosphate regulon sensor histidine kinase PhoR [candidate division Zixibacteria bacterium]